MREKNIQEKLMILNLSHGMKGLPLKTTKLVGNHLQEKQQNPALQRFRKVKTIKKRHRNTSLPYRNKQSLIRKPSTTWSGKVYARPAGDPMKDLDVNRGTWEYL